MIPLGAVVDVFGVEVRDKIDTGGWVEQVEPSNKLVRTKMTPKGILSRSMDAHY